MNPFADHGLYKDKITISQVIQYLGKYGVEYKKSTIQYYLSIRLIPALHGGRYYEKKHLQLLYVIYFLKDIFALDVISMAISPYFDEPSELVAMFGDASHDEPTIKPMIKAAVLVHKNMNS